MALLRKKLTIANDPVAPQAAGGRPHSAKPLAAIGIHLAGQSVASVILTAFVVFSLGLVVGMLAMGQNHTTPVADTPRLPVVAVTVTKDTASDEGTEAGSVAIDDGIRLPDDSRFQQALLDVAGQAAPTTGVVSEKPSTIQQMPMPTKTTTSVDKILARARTLSEGQDLDGAVVVLMEGAEKQPNNPLLRFELARVYDRQHAARNALDEYVALLHLPRAVQAGLPLDAIRDRADYLALLLSRKNHDVVKSNR